MYFSAPAKASEFSNVSKAIAPPASDLIKKNSMSGAPSSKAANGKRAEKDKVSSNSINGTTA